MTDTTTEVLPSDAPDEASLHTSSAANAPPPESDAPAPDKPRRWRTWLALLALLLALAALVSSYLLWRESIAALSNSARKTAQLEARLDHAETATQTATRQLSGELANATKAASDSQAQLGTLQSQQQELRQSLQALHARQRRAETPQALAEAESLLRIANHRLLLERDLSTALAALSAADRGLQETGDPGAARIRQTLADEITALSAVPQPDVTGMAQTLNSLINRVEQLPLASSAAPSSAASNSASKADDWREFLSKIWSELKGLVVIRQGNEIARPFIAPERSYFLYQNLRLELQTARLALLRHDAQSYRNSLTNTSAWLKSYFNNQDPAVQSALETLARLEDIDIDPDFPPISTSLKELQELIIDHASSTTAPPSPESSTTIELLESPPEEPEVPAPPTPSEAGSTNL